MGALEKMIQDREGALHETRKNWFQLRARLESLISFFRHCSLCEAGFTSANPLCPACWDLHFGLSAQKRLVFPEGSDLCDTMALLAWPSGDLTTAELVLGLKGGTFPVAFQTLASEFVRILGINERWIRSVVRQELVLVPAPPRREGAQDHADQWARALSEILGIGVERLLMRDPRGRDQRELSRAERAEIRLHLQPGRKVDPEKIYIFVDDVLTSGATFRAARAQLLGSRGIWGWFIAHRT